MSQIVVIVIVLHVVQVKELIKNEMSFTCIYFLIMLEYYFSVHKKLPYNFL